MEVVIPNQHGCCEKCQGYHKHYVKPFMRNMVYPFLSFPFSLCCIYHKKALLYKTHRACVLSCFSLVWLCNPTDHSWVPGSSVHGILQARILEWVAMPCSRGSSQPEDWTHISYVYLHWQVGSEKAMAPHSSTLAWKIPWTEEPGGLQSMGSRRVRHDWETSFSLSLPLAPPGKLRKSTNWE